ncbi:hypothetical protein HK098_000686 [Nowakowskiella sp. JEL0407]|nr:hypothetical protein HK098_000686 [Nowakowskiella sp. JEL0407]
MNLITYLFVHLRPEIPKKIKEDFAPVLKAEEAVKNDVTTAIVNLPEPSFNAAVQEMKVETYRATSNSVEDLVLALADNDDSNKPNLLVNHTEKSHRIESIPVFRGSSKSEVIEISNSKSEVSDVIIQLPNLKDHNQFIIGQGYNIKTQESTQYHILPKRESMQFKKLVTEVVGIDQSTITFTANEKSSKKLSKIGLDGRSSVGVLFGLIKVGGNFHFLKQNTSKDRSVEATLIYRYEDREEVTVIDHGIADLDTTRILTEETDSTHIVTKVVYGGDTRFVPLRKLDLGINAIIASLDIGGSGQYNSSDSDFLNETRISINGTFKFDDKIPSNPLEVIEFFRTIPSKMRHHSNHHVRYELTSLNCIQRKLGSTFKNLVRIRTLEDGVVERMLGLMDDLQSEVKKANNAARRILNGRFKDYLSSKVLRDILGQQTKLDQSLSRLISDMRDYLTCDDGEDPDAIINEVLEHVTLLRKKIDHFMKSCNLQHEFIDLIVNKLYPNVSVVTEEFDLNGEISLHLHKYQDGQVFTYTEDFDKRSLSMANRLITTRLIEKHHADPKIKFFIRLVTTPYRA